MRRRFYPFWVARIREDLYAQYCLFKMSNFANRKSAKRDKNEPSTISIKTNNSEVRDNAHVWSGDKLLGALSLREKRKNSKLSLLPSYSEMMFFESSKKDSSSSSLQLSSLHNSLVSFIKNQHGTVSTRLLEESIERAILFINTMQKLKQRWNSEMAQQNLKSKQIEKAQTVLKTAKKLQETIVKPNQTSKTKQERSENEQPIESGSETEQEVEEESEGLLWEIDQGFEAGQEAETETKDLKVSETEKKDLKVSETEKKSGTDPELESTGEQNTKQDRNKFILDDLYEEVCNLLNKQERSEFLTKDFCEILLSFKALYKSNDNGEFAEDATVNLSQ